MSDYKFNADRIKGIDVDSGSPSDGDALLYDSNGNIIVWGKPTVDGNAEQIQGTWVSSSTPSTGDVLELQEGQIDFWGPLPRGSGEWTLHFPVAYFASTSNLYEGNAYFHLTWGSGTRGDIANAGSGTIYADIPLIPWLRQGDTITECYFRSYRETTGIDRVKIGLYRTTASQSLQVIAEADPPSFHTDWEDIALHQEDSDPFPYTLNSFEERNLVAGIEISDNPSWRYLRALWVIITFER